MYAKLISIGNSKGIRIPVDILKALGKPDSFNLLLDEKKHTIQLVAVNKPRQGWAKAASNLHNDNGDELLIDDCFDVDEAENHLD